MSNFAFLAVEFPAVHEAAVEAERQAAIRLPYGNISGTI
jgi:type I restriction enzyme R subunit